MTYTLDRLAAEAEELLLDRFEYDCGWALGLRMREAAARAKAPVAITVTHGTALVFSVLMPGATLDNLDWTARKRAVYMPCGPFTRIVSVTVTSVSLPTKVSSG